MSDARGRGSPGLCTFFSSAHLSSSSHKSRIKQPRRGSLQAPFFARNFHYQPITPGPLLSVPTENGRRRRGVLPGEAPRDSPWKFPVFLRAAPAIFKSVVRGRNARALKGRSRDFSSRTRNYEDGASQHKREWKSKDDSIFRVSQFHDS